MDSWCRIGLIQHIGQTYEIKAPLEKVWQALTDADMAEQWGAGPAEFDATEGGGFSYWDGDINGTNTKIVPNELLEQDWYGHDDPEHCYKVSLTFTSDGTVATVRLRHSYVPDSEVKDMVDGWKDYYFDPIKQLLEA